MAEPRDPDTHDDGGGGVIGRARAATGRLALRPMRAVANAGKDALADEAERAIDSFAAGPLPEAVGRSIVTHHVVERIVASALEAKAAETPAEGSPLDLERMEEVVQQALASPALERMLLETVHSKLTAQLADEIIASPAFKSLLTGVLTSPEFRHALQRQTAGFGSDIATATRGKARSADGAIEAGVHRWLRRPRPDVDVPYGGLLTRGAALLLDAMFANIVVLIAGSLVSLVASLFGTLRPAWLVGALAASGWLLIVVVYFAGFWAIVGRTPGMWLMRVRVVARSGDPPSLWRSLLRVVGLALAIIPLFAGFLPALVDRRRRALPDYLAGTTVVYDSPRQD
jgi:uncharacterized RDD family membrane protein YckC